MEIVTADLTIAGFDPYELKRPFALVSFELVIPDHKDPRAPSIS